MKKETIFKNKTFVIIFATLSALAWAGAFPLIKIGLTEFSIAPADTGAKTLFAGIRFFVAGIIVLIIAKAMKRSFEIKSKNDFWLLLFFGFVNTSLHYFFFYLGLSNSSGSRSAILDSMGTFLLIILATIIFKDEHITLKKVVGCLLGFAGILIINLGSGLEGSGAFTFMGDGMIVLSAISSAFAGVLTRIVTNKIEPLFATGVSLAFGGAILVGAGFAMGGRITSFTPKGIIVLILLILVSALGFSLFNQLICYNPVSEIAIFNSLIPIMGVILSCVFLHEEFLLKYIVAGVLVTAGVYVINRKKRVKYEKNKFKKVKEDREKAKNEQGD